MRLSQRRYDAVLASFATSYNALPGGVLGWVGSVSVRQRFWLARHRPISAITQLQHLLPSPLEAPQHEMRL